MIRAGTSPKRLSLDAGLNAGYVRDLLRGKSQNPKARELARIAAALKCDVSELTGGDASAGNQHGVKVPEGLADPPLLLIVWDLLLPAEQEDALRYMMSLIPKRSHGT